MRCVLFLFCFSVWLAVLTGLALLGVFVVLLLRACCVCFACFGWFVRFSCFALLITASTRHNLAQPGTTWHNLVTSGRGWGSGGGGHGEFERADVRGVAGGVGRGAWVVGVMVGQDAGPGWE